jgi:hypothetical protein
MGQRMGYGKLMLNDGQERCNRRGGGQGIVFTVER